MSPTLQLADALAAGASRAVSRAAESLMSRRFPEGYWCGELTADTTLESDFILLQLWMYPPQGADWNPPTRDLVGKAARSILTRQLDDGGFNTHPHGPADVSATVKAYFALKLAGLDPADPRLARARERILDLGGIQAANSYVKVNLSLFGLYPREHTPSIPPEMVLLGKFLYRMSSWTRAIVVPLSIVHASDPRRPAPEGFTLAELYAPGRDTALPPRAERFGWRNVFLWLDRRLRWWERHGSKTIRNISVRRAERWMIEHMRLSDGLGAIYPPMMYAIMAMDVLGYAPDHPDRLEAVRQFMNLMVDDGERFFFQPCFSPVWDTAIAAFAAGESGLVTPSALQPTAEWLLGKEVRRQGDWSVMRPKTEPSGWYFEFANEFYPDIDDTAMVLLALKHARARDHRAQEAAVARAVRWLLDMQSADGGWAAFDVDNNWHPLSEVPFADHNAMLDPTCPDITGRVIEGLCASGVPGDHPAIRKGVAYLLRTQEQDGSWFGRWGVNYVYGTFLALRGLRAAGIGDRAPAVLRGGEWLRSIQNPDGGWGESCASYDQGRFVAASSTASQTAWGLLGLLASGDRDSDSARRAVERLVGTQREDGTWHEDLATGTGFPRVFYLTYHLYRDMFPLLALAEYLKRGA
jgi:squalene-hopene/tetraprenyl-beta-curcumene cyclase